MIRLSSDTHGSSLQRTGCTLRPMQADSLIEITVTKQDFRVDLSRLLIISRLAQKSAHGGQLGLSVHLLSCPTCKQGHSHMGRPPSPLCSHMLILSGQVSSFKKILRWQCPAAVCAG
eukprot:scaffold198749_cov33-Tisochrysis_lutea.AAC.1